MAFFCAASFCTTAFSGIDEQSTSERIVPQTKVSEDSSIPSHRIYTTLADDNQTPTREQLSEFDCTDKIFLVLEIDNFPHREHQFSVRWIGPAGEQREHTQYPFWVRSEKEHRVWAWLSLSRARGAGMLTFVNPAAGLEEFVGEWKIEVRLDNELLGEHNFVVIC